MPLAIICPACSLIRMRQSGIAERPSLRTERQLAGSDAVHIAGVDEAGRGPWAGPVVAAAVIFKDVNIPEWLNDSKLLTAEKRAALFEIINEQAWVGVSIVSVDEIDKLNILRATLLAMSQAVETLPSPPDVALIDGNRAPSISQRAVPVVKGDRRCPSIAAASIVAKVTRDRLMAQLSENFPVYGWCANKGYGTPAHARAIAEHGVTAHHRRSFAPIRLALSKAASGVATT